MPPSSSPNLHVGLINYGAFDFSVDSFEDKEPRDTAHSHQVEESEVYLCGSLSTYKKGAHATSDVARESPPDPWDRLCSSGKAVKQ